MFKNNKMADRIAWVLFTLTGSIVVIGIIDLVVELLLRDRIAEAIILIVMGTIFGYGAFGLARYAVKEGIFKD
jgi:hypothetical protein